MDHGRTGPGGNALIEPDGRNRRATGKKESTLKNFMQVSVTDEIIKKPV